MKYNAPSHCLLHYFSNIYLQCKTIYKYEMLTFICVIIYLNPSIEYFSFFIMNNFLLGPLSLHSFFFFFSIWDKILLKI